MANAPSHGTNAATKMVSVYNKSGEEFTVSRLNALDLTRGGEYFWKPEDINKPRPEEEGPADPKAKTQTIYDAEGKPYALDMANARDMVNTGKYFWNDPTGSAPTPAETLDNAITAANALADAETAAVEGDQPDAATVETVETVDPDVDPATETLVDQAARVTGSDDVVAYLEGFAPERLRDMANERYGEKIHHRSSKDTIIQKIVELEDARTVGDDQADA